MVLSFSSVAISGERTAGSGQRGADSGQQVAIKKFRLTATCYPLFRGIFFIIVLSAYLTPSLATASQASLQAQMIEGGILTSIPPGAQRVPMGVLRLSASCTSAIEVQSITLWHRGLGAASDIESVYFESDGGRLGRGRQITSRDGRIEIHLNGYTVPSCRSRDVRIFANFSATSSVSGEHRFDLFSAADIVADARVVIAHPLSSSTRRTVGQTVGSIAVEYRDILTPVRYGSQRTVSRFLLRADGRDDHVIRAITFTNNGSARDLDLQNLFIESSGRRVSLITAHLIGDQVRIVLDPPFSLERNQERLLSLKADILASRSRTIQFVIEEQSDIDAEVARGRR